MWRPARGRRTSAFDAAVAAEVRQRAALLVVDAQHAVARRQQALLQQHAQGNAPSAAARRRGLGAFTACCRRGRPPLSAQLLLRTSGLRCAQRGSYSTSYLSPGLASLSERSLKQHLQTLARDCHSPICFTSKLSAMIQCRNIFRIAGITTSAKTRPSAHPLQQIVVAVGISAAVCVQRRPCRHVSPT